MKYINNLIEQDQRYVGRCNKFYRNLGTASKTIKGVETILRIYKKSQRNEILFSFSFSTEIKALMDIAD